MTPPPAPAPNDNPPGCDPQAQCRPRNLKLSQYLAANGYHITNIKLDAPNQQWVVTRCGMADDYVSY